MKFRKCLNSIYQKIENRLTQLPDNDVIEDILDELDMQIVHAKPHSLESLSRRTLFEKNEIKDIYRRFKQECPNGYLTEETFRSVFQQFFPVGDTNQYAHFVFNTFERDQYGNVLFENFLQVMSVILKGNTEQKLEWVFKLYDIDRDEVLSRQDLKLVVESMYYMVGKNCESEEMAVKRHVDSVMKRYSRDPMCNEITLRQFKEACCTDEDVINSMNSFGNIFFNEF